jgi:hypothetical protein
MNINNPGYPMLNHAGGGSHLGGADYRGQNCSSCHAHSADGTAGTRDGFMPGTCRGCHSEIQGTRRRVAGASGDFIRSSHHVVGNQAGTVRLFNVDTPAIVYALEGSGDATDYENFCVSCHDANGAAGDVTPFSDNTAVITINMTAWTSASHNTVVSSFTGSCRDCHDNGHGSNKTKLLAPWNYTNDGNADDGLRQEERFCFICHDATGPSTKNLETPYGYAVNWVDQVVHDNLNMNDRHDVQLSAQNVSGAKIECVNCHNPHTDNAITKVIANPDPTDGRTPGSGYFAGTNFMSDWCLDCHDGSMPAAITQPTIALLNVNSFMAGDAHGLGNGNATLKNGYGYVDNMTVNCMSCHTSHVGGTTPVTGSTNFFQLLIRVKSTDGLTDVPTDGGGFNYETTNNLNTAPDTTSGWNWCNTCHTSSMNNSNCFRCHYHGTRW